MDETQLLSSGFIIVGAYDDKVRRTLFGMAKGKAPQQELARAAGELNKLLYRIFVDELKLDKGDVVRVKIPYVIKDGKVFWDYPQLSIEVYKKMKEEELKKVVDKVIKEIEVVIVEKPLYILKPRTTTLTGEIVFDVVIKDRKVESVKAIKEGDKWRIWGAVLEPFPSIFEGEEIEVSMTDELQAIFGGLMKKGKIIDKKKALGFLKDLGLS